MNLLPEHYKKDLIYEAWRRYLLFFGPYLMVISVIATALLLPSYFFLIFQIDGKEKTLQSVTGGEEYKKTIQGGEEVTRTNTLIKTFISYERGVRRIPPILDDIFARIPEGVRVASVNYSKESANGMKMDLVGVASDRETFKLLVKTLKESSIVADVEYPQTLLVEDKDISFSLAIGLK